MRFCDYVYTTKSSQLFKSKEKKKNTTDTSQDEV